MSDWVNLQRYLELNADQGADMGQRVYGDISQKAQKAKNQLDQDVNSYGNEVQRGTVQGPRDPNDLTQDEGAVAANAVKSYSGPKSLDQYDPTLAGNVNQASLDVQAAADPNQRGSVVQETFGAQGASGVGGSALDSFLVGASPAGEELAGLGKQYHGLLGSLGLGETDAYAKSQLGMAQSDANANKWAQLGTQIAGKKPGAESPMSGMLGRDAFGGQAFDQGQAAADANGGQVVLSQRDNETGAGWNRGAFGAGKPTINVWGKTPQEKASNWWGKAGGPLPGDKSIPAAGWYALALLTPEARGKWWNEHHEGVGHG